MRTRRIGRTAVRAVAVALLGLGVVIGPAVAANADDFDWTLFKQQPVVGDTIRLQSGGHTSIAE